LLLQKFSDNQACIVIRINAAIYLYGISQTSSGATVSSRARKYRYAISSYTGPRPAW